tara:strand:+ start:1668 stop:2270 length:603 start_codon:yes stop_codon:yes gene_type:complete
MKHIKEFKQFSNNDLVEAISSIYNGTLNESEINQLLDEGIFSWLGNLFSNPRKKRELDQLAKKLVEIRVEIGKLQIEEDKIEEFEKELKAKEDAYGDTNKPKPSYEKIDKNNIAEVQLKLLKETESDIIAGMDNIGSENPNNKILSRYVNKVKLESRMESTEAIMKIADAGIKRVLSKMAKDDKAKIKDIDKEIQISVNK